MIYAGGQYGNFSESGTGTLFFRGSAYIVYVFVNNLSLLLPMEFFAVLS